MTVTLAYIGTLVLFAIAIALMNYGPIPPLYVGLGYLLLVCALWYPLRRQRASHAYAVIVTTILLAVLMILLIPRSAGAHPLRFTEALPAGAVSNEITGPCGPMSAVVNGAALVIHYDAACNPVATQVNGGIAMPLDPSRTPRFGYIDAISSTGLVSGWAGATASLITQPVTIEVDGSVVGVAMTGNPRPDVFEALPDYGALAGFTFQLPDWYGDGRVHSLRSYVRNADGSTQALGNTPIQFSYVVPQSRPFGYFDVIDSAGRIFGWATDPAQQHVRIAVVVDDFVKSIVSTGDARPDVGAALPGTGTAVGYHAQFPALGTSDRHVVRLYALDAQNREHELASSPRYVYCYPYPDVSSIACSPIAPFSTVSDDESTKAVSAKPGASAPANVTVNGGYWLTWDTCDPNLPSCQALAINAESSTEAHSRAHARFGYGFCFEDKSPLAAPDNSTCGSPSWQCDANANPRQRPAGYYSLDVETRGFYSDPFRTPHDLYSRCDVQATHAGHYWRCAYPSTAAGASWMRVIAGDGWPAKNAVGDRVCPGDPDCDRRRAQWLQECSIKLAVSGAACSALALLPGSGPAFVAMCAASVAAMNAECITSAPHC